MRRARVLLADDHVIVAQGLASLLRDEFDFVGTVGDGRALVESARKLRPDVVVADMSMPVMSGLDAMRQLQNEGVPVKVIFLTMHADARIACEAVRAGASGYVLKHSAGEELIRAIREVLEGRVYLTPLIAKDVLATLADPATQSEVRLKPRHRQILQLLVAGRTMKEIATELGLSPRTIETHKYEMMQDLGVTSSAELIRYAVQRGIGSS